MGDIVLLAPLPGWATTLDEVDDEVFAARMLGDGVAIDPTDGTLRAPCDGEVTALPASAHAVALRAEGGAPLLLHVGIDTVALKGEGFRALVREGQHVHAGDPLLAFDLDRVARGARSLLTPVIVTELEQYRIVERRSGVLLRAGDPLMTLRAARSASAEVAPAGNSFTGVLKISLPYGLHARPAALLTQALRDLRADGTLSLRGKVANVRSTVALLSLGARHGDILELQAHGADASLVPRALERALARAASMADIGDRGTNAVRTPAQPAAAVIAVPGIAVGPLVPVAKRHADVPQRGAGEQIERRRLDEARARLAARLRRRAGDTGGAAAQILGAHLEFLGDPELLAAASRDIAAGKSAEFAWRQAVDAAVRQLGSVDDARLRARTVDLRDVEAQLQDELAGNADRAASEIPAGAILVARDLLPSQFMACASRIAGICTVSRAATSHVSILAGARGLPMLAGVDESLLDVLEGTTVIVDAEHGRVDVAPGPAELAEARRRIADRGRERLQLRAAAALDCRTADGERIAIRANVGSLAEAVAAVEAGAEGCGLLRTEFLYLERREPPGVEEQRAQYQAIVDAMDGRPVVVRTLDAGSDKAIPFLEMPPQDNPALGLRGIRASLWRPGVLRTQLEAILATRPPGRCRILLPMVTEPAEIVAVRALLREIVQAAGEDPVVEVGIMIETPAAALEAASLAAHADFFSIGTNDLTQYVLAIDRTHPLLSEGLDALHPVILRLIGSVCTAARAADRPVAVCGGLASEPAAAPLLVGLGVAELSAVPDAIPAIKEALRRRTLAECRDLAGRALSGPDAGAVRALLAGFAAGAAP